MGQTGSLTQHQPYLGVNDYHTLAEISVESADLRQIVEVGWTVDRGVNGDSLPHLFVFHWVNGAPTCYYGCGFVPVQSPWSPGSPVSVTLVPQAYAIVHFPGAAIGAFCPGSRRDVQPRIATLQMRRLWWPRRTKTDSRRCSRHARSAISPISRSCVSNERTSSQP